MCGRRSGGQLAVPMLDGLERLEWTVSPQTPGVGDYGSAVRLTRYQKSRIPVVLAVAG
ncbi:hypothetical protein AArc1_3406 [Natrarchaeobaculum sulfurireducens]|uniref:Uncharacterized protein n=1 Tax=Natrarchaeobaculum sulfurireducens TaxID=2044521 RepID=A0A346PJK4_9EURY|nr:hypothetical protein AArc1_3406 [Natrarchaeobaculum sulfurireducens]